MSRPAVAALDAVLEQQHRVLDHGFVTPIDYMGDDAAIVQAARVSYGKGTRQYRDAAALIQYLFRHGHTSPFEMCEIKLHVRAPIFVTRQWLRHRTANVNEVSGRYSEMPDLCYVPAAEDVTRQSATNRQGRGEKLPPAHAQAVAAVMAGANGSAMRCYRGFLEGDGVARELARIVVPLSVYTEFVWKIDLHNLLHFLHRRLADDAQLEIRAYATTILAIVEKWVPLSAAAFRRERLEAFTLSAPAITVVREMLAGRAVAAAESGLSARDWRDLMSILQG